MFTVYLSFSPSQLFPSPLFLLFYFIQSFENLSAIVAGTPGVLFFFFFIIPFSHLIPAVHPARRPFWPPSSCLLSEPLPSLLEMRLMVHWSLISKTIYRSYASLAAPFVFLDFDCHSVLRPPLIEPLFWHRKRLCTTWRRQLLRRLLEPKLHRIYGVEMFLVQRNPVSHMHSTRMMIKRTGLQYETILSLSVIFWREYSNDVLSRQAHTSLFYSVGNL